MSSLKINIIINIIITIQIETILRSDQLFIPHRDFCFDPVIQTIE